MKEILLSLGYELDIVNSQLSVESFVKEAEHFTIIINQHKKTKKSTMLFVDNDNEGEPILISTNINNENIEKFEEFLKVL